MNAPFSFAERLQTAFNAIVGVKSLRPLPTSYFEAPGWQSCIDELHAPAIWRRKRIR